MGISPGVAREGSVPFNQGPNRQHAIAVCDTYGPDVIEMVVLILEAVGVFMGKSNLGFGA
jgi:hypothetical protein